MIEEAEWSCENLKEVIYLDKDWEQFLTQSEKYNDEQLKAVEQSIQFDDPVNIQYTSGTTGFPKGCYPFALQYFKQRLLYWQAAQLYRTGQSLHTCSILSLFWNGDG